MIVESNKAFYYAALLYSDISCTTQTTLTELIGTLVIGTDMVLDDGSTGNPVELTITSPGSDTQYTIFQLDNTDNNILRMGVVYPDATSLETNNSVTGGLEFSRVL